MWKAVVKGFAGIFFEMEARDADALFFTVDFDFEPAAGGQGQFVLRDLVALGQVWIEIILARET